MSSHLKHNLSVRHFLQLGIDSEQEIQANGETEDFIYDSLQFKEQLGLLKVKEL